VFGLFASEKRQLVSSYISISYDFRIYEGDFLKVLFVGLLMKYMFSVMYELRPKKQLFKN